MFSKASSFPTSQRAADSSRHTSQSTNQPPIISRASSTASTTGIPSLHDLRNSGDDVFATLLRISKESQSNHPPVSATPTAGTTTQKPAEFSSLKIPLSTDLRPGEKRFRQPVSPSFHSPRGRLTKLFSDTIETSGAGRDSVDGKSFGPSTVRGNNLANSSDNQSINRSSTQSASSWGSPSNFSLLSGYSASSSTGNRSSTQSPTGSDMPFGSSAVTSPLQSSSRKSSEPKTSFLVSSVDSATKKRKLADSITLMDDSLNASQFSSPSARPAEVVRLETEVRRLQFERDSATKLVETERLRTGEELSRRRREEEEISKNTAEMWSQAEKIIAENDRLKMRVEKADLEALTTRKKYEEQIAAIRTESMDKERTLDATLRETRMENLGLNDKLRCLTRERGLLAEEVDLLKKRLVIIDKQASAAHALKAEVHSLNNQLQAKDGQLADLKKTNDLLSNLSDEMRNYRELQVNVPLLQKDNQKLREKAALARANEDKILALEDNIKRYEERQCRFYDLELENEQLRNRLAEWDSADAIQSPSKKPDGIQKLIDKVSDLETLRKHLGDELATKTQSVLQITSENENLQRRLAELKAQLETSESIRTRLEQSQQEITSKLAATQQERDTLKLIKETIDSSTTRRDPLTQTKIHALEERATRTQTLAADFEQLYEKSSAKEKELQAQLIDLQNRCNEETIRVESLTQELEKLRKSDFSVSSSAHGEDSSFVREAKGGYDPLTQQILTYHLSPADAAEKRFLEDAARVMEENKLLQEKLSQIRAAGSYPTDLTMRAEEFVQGPGEQLEELKKQLAKLQQAKTSDMQGFKNYSNNFKQACKELLGWNIRVEANRVVLKLADGSPNDSVVFEREDDSKPWELRPSDFATSHTALVNEFLRSHNSPPGFFARIVLQALSERTLICPM
ncbi:hypothetical protein BV898_02014 [Hypsibius exemplaris]|uniref:Mitotic spindle assembly checkpoint protein MAD1 n=1 Tax=Hypsibius exemplaris TaxID=2072580 RepID=A0A1W0X9H8_HYPEX|nr:hypothetical protein BV898_02014 [Hypsibius exemplaris]